MKRLILMTCAALGLLSGCATFSVPDDTLVHEGQTIRTIFFSLKYPVGAPEANKVLRYAQENLTQIPGVEDFQILKQTDEKSGCQYRMTLLFPSKPALELYKRHVLRQRVVAEIQKHQLFYYVYDFTPFDYSDAAPQK